MKKTVWVARESEDAIQQGRDPMWCVYYLDGETDLPKAVIALSTKHRAKQFLRGWYKALKSKRTLVVVDDGGGQ